MYSNYKCILYNKNLNRNENVLLATGFTGSMHVMDAASNRDLNASHLTRSKENAFDFQKPCKSVTPGTELNLNNPLL